MKTLSRLIIILAMLSLGVLACNLPGTGQEETAAPIEEGPPPADGGAGQPGDATDPGGLPPAPTPELPTPTSISDPGSQPTAFVPPSAPDPNVNYEGISFYRDNTLASEWFAEIVPREDPASGAPEAWLIPSHYHFTFGGYPLSDTFHQAQIYVFPVSGFTDYNPIGEEQIGLLNSYLQNPPPQEPETYPFIPIFNAAQFFVTKQTRLDFQNGSGVRFLTEYAQALTPITSKHLFYTYQGLTTDGNYYISVIMPVSHPSLPPDDSYLTDPAVYAQFEANFENYLKETKDALNVVPDNSFTPSLTLLDTLVQSIHIDR